VDELSVTIPSPSSVRRRPLSTWPELTRETAARSPLKGSRWVRFDGVGRAYGPKMTRLLAHVRANVIAYLALFIAMSGTSYAVTQLPVNSVGAKQLKSNAVTEAKVKDGSLLGKDFKAGQLPAGATGPPGSAGAAGPAGTGIVARVRFTGDQVGTDVASSVPLTGAGYQQAATEIDTFYGRATIDVPRNITCSATNQAATLSLKVGSLTVLQLTVNTALFDDPAPSQQFILEPTVFRDLFEPGSPTARTMTATFIDSCDGASRFHLRGIRVDVVGVN
jgi:hypothetical protein